MFGNFNTSEVKSSPLKLDDLTVYERVNPLRQIPINKIQFTFLSDYEINKLSVLEITSTNLLADGSVNDLKLGSYLANQVCKTCNESREICPGHFGHIKLCYPIPHPLREKQILNYLRCFCPHKNCRDTNNGQTRFILTEEILKILKLDGIIPNKFNLILDEITKKHNICFHCSQIMRNYSVSDNKYSYTINKDNKEYELLYEEINSIFSNINQEDLKLMGLDINPNNNSNISLIHPHRLIITNLPVLPTCARPPVYSMIIYLKMI